jgi:NAD(P) transhydrogenase subunit beta
MQTSVYQILCLVLAVLILYGIKLMSSPQTAPRGNQLGALGMFSAILLVLFYNGILDQTLLWAAILLGGIIGYFFTVSGIAETLRSPHMISFGTPNVRPLNCIGHPSPFIIV